MSSVITNTIIITIFTTVMIAVIGGIIIKPTGTLMENLIVEWKSNWNGCEGIYLHFESAELLPPPSVWSHGAAFVCLGCFRFAVGFIIVHRSACEQRVLTSMRQGDGWSRYGKRMSEIVPVKAFQDKWSLTLNSSWMSQIPSGKSLSSILHNSERQDCHSDLSLSILWPISSFEQKEERCRG